MTRIDEALALAECVRLKPTLAEGGVAIRTAIHGAEERGYKNGSDRMWGLLHDAVFASTCTQEAAVALFEAANRLLGVGYDPFKEARNEGERIGIEKTAALVRQAFREGHSKGVSAGHPLSGTPDEKRDWENSWVSDDYKALLEKRD